MVNPPLNAGFGLCATGGRQPGSLASSRFCLPIPRRQPYVGAADGSRFRFCRVRVSGMPIDETWIGATAGGSGDTVGPSRCPFRRMTGMRGRQVAVRTNIVGDMNPRRRKWRRRSRPMVMRAHTTTKAERVAAEWLRRRVRLCVRPPNDPTLSFPRSTPNSARSPSCEALPPHLRPVAGVPPAAKRHFNGQQNAYRRSSSGRDPGGRAARQSCRRVRFRIGSPPATAR